MRRSVARRSPALRAPPGGVSDLQDHADLFKNDCPRDLDRFIDYFGLGPGRRARSYAVTFARSWAVDVVWLRPRPTNGGLTLVAAR
jgi:hypothetical protein